MHDFFNSLYMYLSLETNEVSQYHPILIDYLKYYWISIIFNLVSWGSAYLLVSIYMYALAVLLGNSSSERIII